MLGLCSIQTSEEVFYQFSSARFQFHFLFQETGIKKEIENTRLNIQPVTLTFWEVN